MVTSINIGLIYCNLTETENKFSTRVDKIRNRSCFIPMFSPLPGIHTLDCQMLTFVIGAVLDCRCEAEESCRERTKQPFSTCFSNCLKFKLFQL